jgi:2,3-bisphosphoglycerate-dependent phosphoglycerate mutase
MHLYLIRHCQSSNNAVLDKKQSSDENVPGGAWVDEMVPDPPLTDKGVKQGKILARFLSEHGDSNTSQNPPHDTQNISGFNISHIYCSLMTRSIVTAEYVSQALQLPLVVWQDIHECGGVFTKDADSGKRIGIPGPNYEYFRSKYPDLVIPEKIDADGWWNRPTENLDDIEKRVNRVHNQILERHAGKDHRVAMVTHVGFYHHLLSSILNVHKSPKRDLWLHLNNAAISHIDFNREGTRVNYLNRADYMPRELIT